MKEKEIEISDQEKKQKREKKDADKNNDIHENPSFEESHFSLPKNEVSYSCRSIGSEWKRENLIVNYTQVEEK